MQNLKMLIKNKFFLFFTGISFFLTVLAVYIIKNTDSGITATPKSVKALTQCSVSRAAELIQPNVIKIINKTVDKEIIGSGFLLSSGYIVTNSHIVDKKGEISLVYSDGFPSNATLYANDIKNDIALLLPGQIYGQSLPISAKNLEPNTPLVALGYSENKNNEITAMEQIYVEAKQQDGINILKTDKPIPEYYSGGPLVDMCGKVKGINTYIPDNEDSNLAISVDSMQKIVSAISASKQVAYQDDSKNQTNSIIIDYYKNNPTPPGPKKPGKTYGMPKPVCYQMRTWKNEIELNEETIISFDASISGPVIWSGGGTFFNTYTTGTSWKSNKPGSYTITVTNKNDAGQCSLSTTINVNSPYEEIPGLSRISLSGQMTANESGREYLEFELNYLNSNGNIIEPISRTATLPISANVSVYRYKNGVEDRLLYSGSFKNSEILSRSNTRVIRILKSNINVSLEDANSTTGWFNMIFHITIHTPKQGNYATEQIGGWN